MVQLRLSAAQAAIAAWWREEASCKEPEEAAGTIPGLANLGNTCFMNSVLQCLLNTPAWLAEACRSFNTLEPGSEQSGKAVLGRGFAQLVAEYNATDGRPLARSNPALKNLKKAIATLDPQYAGCQQQDAYEFLGCLLEGLEENFRALFGPSLAAPGASAASVVRAVCGVTSHSARCCHACARRFRVDEVTDTALRVPLISPSAQMDQAAREEEEAMPTSLAELLEAARRPEDIEGYDCDGCREAAAEGAEVKRSTVTQHAGVITATRDVVVVVLYRFCHGLDSMGRFKPMKVRRQVACPTVLEMEMGEYHLFGVVSHIGSSLSAGHYISAVKSLRDDMWYECDDERVRPLSLTALYGSRSVTSVREGADPYILFYHLKKADPPPQLPAPAEESEPAVPDGAGSLKRKLEEEVPVLEAAPVDDAGSADAELPASAQEEVMMPAAASVDDDGSAAAELPDSAEEEVPMPAAASEDDRGSAAAELPDSAEEEAPVPVAAPIEECGSAAAELPASATEDLPASGPSDQCTASAASHELLEDWVMVEKSPEGSGPL